MSTLYTTAAVRRCPGGSFTFYLAHVRCARAVDAPSILGDKIRKNDLTGVHVVYGTHVPVKAGDLAGIISCSATPTPENPA